MLTTVMALVAVFAFGVYVGMLIYERNNKTGWEMSRIFARNAMRAVAMWATIPWDSIHEVIRLARIAARYEAGAQSDAVSEVADWIYMMKDEKVDMPEPGHVVTLPPGTNLF